MRTPLIYLAVILLVWSWVSPAHSAYVLENGHGVPVCEKYRDNLNAANPKVPYGTNRPIDSAFPEFKAIEWGSPEGARFPAAEIVKFFWDRDANPAWYLEFPDQWLKWRGTSKDIQLAKKNYLRQIGDRARGYAQEVSFRTARVDIDNDGVQDDVVQFAPNLETQLLVVLRPSLAQIDYLKSRLVLRHPAWKKKSSGIFRRQESGKPFNAAFAKIGLEPVEHALFGASYGIFSFQGKVYYDLWWLNDPQAAHSTWPSPEAWRLRIFRATLERASKICSFRFEFL